VLDSATRNSLVTWFSASVSEATALWHYTSLYIIIIMIIIMIMIMIMIIIISIIKPAHLASL